MSKAGFRQRRREREGGRQTHATVEVHHFFLELLGLEVYTPPKKLFLVKLKLRLGEQVRDLQVCIPINLLAKLTSE